ncbi:P-loop NTPase fold protein [Jiulongibacter sediminis]|uniref:KAP NTPase domain-containing protein n=1 Tax=Jiulongibacter sediminis TaxID=1605367 RepID=A0A0P7BSP2_9BACT|nr:P-loop NTPase fold protein [Jiulongibacter sediminis]KPM47478.1 hypothetical protein AFM12_13275 [Jiulongibacter sediminis]TBX23272.1 hypothetical protein TK44_13285 [Jiulongibacter sediminis]
MKFDVSSPHKEFTNHLLLPENERILFSGIFGIGKTTFLNEYFKGHSDYVAIHLYPVNYSVVSNDDIFRLIKFDILCELLGRGIEYDLLEVGSWETLSLLSQKETLEALRPFVKSIPKLGKTVDEILSGLRNFVEILHEKKAEITIDTKNEHIKFLKEFSLTSPNLYEEDLITELISELLETLKRPAEEANKKLVLIVDDLDRLDPEHIFRILNVFAAQVDKVGRSKFGFDHVIVVCDVLNIRNIYSHRYGVSVDFNGYLDKFYSHEVFVFDNSLIITKNVYQVLENSSNVLAKKHQSLLQLGNTQNIFTKCLCYILTELINRKRVNLRDIGRIQNLENIVSGRKKVFVNEREIVSGEVPIFLIVDYLLVIFQSWIDLVDSIKACRDFHNVEFNSQQMVSLHETIITGIQILSNIYPNGQSIFILPNSSDEIKVDIRFLQQNYFVSKIIEKDNNPKLNFFELLTEFLIKCEQKGIYN